MPLEGKEKLELACGHPPPAQPGCPECVIHLIDFWGPPLWPLGGPLWSLALHPLLAKEDLPPLREDWQLLAFPSLGQILPPGTRHHDPSVSW